MKYIYILSLLLLTSCQMGTETRQTRVLRETVGGGAYVQENKDSTCYFIKDNGAISCFPKP